MTQEELKKFVIDNRMAYYDFGKRFNISTDNAVKIFQKLDLKKCSKGNNCVNSDGSVQSRQNFSSDKSKRDGLNGQCTYCQQQQHQNNKESYRQKRRQIYQNNKEYYKQKHRQYYQNNKEYYKQRNYHHYQSSKNHHNQKTKEYNNSYAKFDIHNDQISYAEKTRRDPNNLELLQVECTYCGSWFNPINSQVQIRIGALEGKYSQGAENRFYCSKECKQSCPIFKRVLYSKDDPRYLDDLGTSREVQSELRQLVFKRDSWTCQKCSKHKDDLPDGISLHCHHIEGIRWEPFESADIDQCTTVCSECHKEIHQIPGCGPSDMQCGINERDRLVKNYF